MQRTTTATTGSLSTISPEAITTEDMADGFAPGYVFRIQDSAGVMNRIGGIVAGRAGAQVLDAATLDLQSALRARPNLRAVQELLGHSSVTTTQRYTHMDADDLRQQVAELLGNRCRA